MAPRPIPIPDSGNLAQVQYDDETGDLIVQFKGMSGGRAKSARYVGATYIYKQVPINVADGLANSGLRATDYFRANIYRQYEHQRIA